MRLAIGCDHIGFALKGVLAGALEADGHVVLDLGTFSTDPVDYPDYARVVGQAVHRGFVDAGVLACGSGVGAAIAANKIRGVRAALCADAPTARSSREHEDANVLCLSAVGLADEAAIEIVRAWVGAKFSGEDGDVRRVSKLAQLETALSSPDREPARPAAAAPRPAPEVPPARSAPAAATAVVPAASSAPPVEPDAAVVEAAAPARSAAPTAKPTAGPPARDALGHPLVEDTLKFLESQEFLDRLWVKDPSLWRGDPDGIRNRLGWLTSPALMRRHLDELRAFADEIRRLQFSQVVLLGTGGASSAGALFGSAFRAQMGFPDLVALDSTDPAAVKHTLGRITLSRALFVVATKSGATAETLAFYSFFRAQVEASAAPKPGMQFVAITDPGSSLERLATEAGFRRIFLNAPAIGGRYSALSFFGLVPAVLIGVDVKTLLERAQAMVDLSGTGASVRDNPAVRLGAALAAFGQAGRDKITFVLSEPVRALGPWLEQLLAESLGKDGKGLVPVVDEPLGSPVVYGPDRVFVALTLDGDATHDAALAALGEAGHPVIRLTLQDPLDIGAEFFRWEVATATAGAVLGVNPFDEPNVARATDNTAALLAAFRKSRRLPEWPVDAEEDQVALMTRSTPPPRSLGEGLAAFLAQAEARDYVAIQAYLAPIPDTASRLGALRALLRDRLRVATTVAFGPRYLHSTGQLHKGGPANGLYLQIVGEDREDIAVPGADYGFAALKAAQALGDAQALRDAGRRIIRIRLAGKPGPALQQLLLTTRSATRKL